MKKLTYNIPTLIIAGLAVAFLAMFGRSIHAMIGFSNQFRPAVEQSSLSMIEKKAVSGQIFIASDAYGKCLMFRLWNSKEECQTWATRSAVLQAAETGDVSLAQARLRLYHDFNLPLDKEMRRELAHQQVMTQKKALVEIAKR